ncbi:hypothetical protein HDZ31DRAFT_50467, partial [Schizophyllum fasciatum]
PPSAKRVLKTIRKYGVRFDPINPAQTIKENMPLWHHKFISKRKRPRYNTDQCKCLRGHHGVHTVGDAVRATDTWARADGHRAEPDCVCEACEAAREQGCANPNACGNEALKLLAKLPAKWDPRIDYKASYELTPKEEEENAEAQKKGSRVIFDPRIPSETTLRDCYRIFGCKNDQEAQPREDNPLADPDAPYRVVHVQEANVIEEVEGKVVRLAAGIWSGGEPHPSRSEMRTSRLTEGYALTTALLATLKEAREEENVELVIPNKRLIIALTKDLRKHDDEGWLNFPNRPQVRALVAKLRSRPGRTAFRMPKQKERGAMEARKAAERGVLREAPTHRNLTIDSREIRGATLAGLTTKTAYAALMEAKKPGVRKQTAPNLAKVKNALRGNGRKTQVTDKQIWNSLKNRDIRRNVRQFLYKCMHDAHRCGRHWSDIPGCAERTLCHHCSAAGVEVEESMQHILTECEAPGRREIWAEAERLCRARNIPWRAASMGEVLGGALVSIRGEDGKRKIGDERLYRIIMSEAAYAVWLARNERVIQHENDPERYANPSSLPLKLRGQLRRRRAIENVLTDARRFGPKAIPPETTSETWRDLPIDELPQP